MDHSKNVPSKDDPGKHDPSKEVPSKEVPSKEDPSLKTANNRFPKVVMVKNEKGKICTGTLVLDETVLSASACVFSDGTNHQKWSIGFPNDKKTYKVIDANRTDGDLVLLMVRH